MARVSGMSAPAIAARLASRPRAGSDDDSNCVSPNINYPDCSDVGNEMQSCYPTASTIIQQDTWTKLIWNTNEPSFRQFGFVDVFLFNTESSAQVMNWTHQDAQAGQVSSCADDRWLDGLGDAFNGTALNWHFQYVIVPAGQPLTGAQPREPIFTLSQSHALDSVVSASMASSSSAAVAASISSVSGSLSSATTSGPGALQGNSPASNTFPHWAIALLAVLGFLSLLGLTLLGYVFLVQHRSRRRRSHLRRESVGSESPMMAGLVASSPTRPATDTAPAFAGRMGKDGSSTTSRANSAGDGGPFSGADAAIMADAFRNALRRPDFADRPVEEGESPDAAPKEPDSEVLLNRELAEEGRDIRSVRSERGVKVETLSDEGTSGT